MKIPDRAAKAFQSAISGNYAAAFFRLWMGRCTFFAIAFSVVGLYGWLVLARDLTSFALFAGSIQALLLAHSYKEDVAAQNQAQVQQQVVDVNIQK
jgi:hypothetical protein